MTQSRVSRISIDRLYNLGDYEHLKLSLTVDIPEGESATDAFRAASRILIDLSPKRGKVDDYYLKQARKFLAADEDEQARIACVLKDEWTPAVRQEHVAKAQAVLDKHDAYRERRRQAAEALDDLGGVVIRKDAKLEWDDADE